MAGLYNTPDYRQVAMDRLAAARGAYGSMMPKQTTKTTAPGKTAGGALMSGVGGATAASAMGASMTGAGLAGPAGLALGAGFGLGSYLLS